MRKCRLKRVVELTDPVRYMIYLEVTMGAMMIRNVNETNILSLTLFPLNGTATLVFGVSGTGSQPKIRDTEYGTWIWTRVCRGRDAKSPKALTLFSSAFAMPAPGFLRLRYLW